MDKRLAWEYPTLFIWIYSKELGYASACEKGHKYGNVNASIL